MLADGVIGSVTKNSRKKRFRLQIYVTSGIFQAGRPAGFLEKISTTLPSLDPSLPPTSFSRLLQTLDLAVASASS